MLFQPRPVTRADYDVLVLAVFLYAPQDTASAKLANDGTTSSNC
jgi:hypothetical protein